MVNFEKFEEFNFEVLNNHILFPVIDELAQKDDFIRNNRNLIIEGFKKHNQNILKSIVDKFVETKNETDKKFSLELISKIYKIYDASEQRIDSLYHVSLFVSENESMTEREYKLNAERALEKLLNEHYQEENGPSP